jgi:hypothetical protein
MLWAHRRACSAFRQGFKAYTLGRDAEPGGVADPGHDDAEQLGAADVERRRRIEADLRQLTAKREHRRGRANCEIVGASGVATD